MNFELFGIIVYVIAMLGVGYYVSRQIKTDDDYFLAGRSLGPFLATFSIFATWFGAETCIGTAGAVYRQGLGSIHADPLGYSVCIFLMGLFFSQILWRRKITTIPDLFRHRFSPTTEKFAALIMIPSSVIWAGAQIRAFGQILDVTLGYGFTLAITIAAVVVIFYTIAGGLLADAYNDLIQGFAVIIGLAILLATLIYNHGGPVLAFQGIAIEKFSLLSEEARQFSFLGRLELWMVPIMGSLMAQELVSRVVASRSPEVARSSCFRAGALYFFVGMIPVLIGLLGSQHYPGATESESIMPLLAKQHLHPVLYVIFVGAMVSAILSTVDSTLLAVSALLGHNLIYPSVKNLTDKKKVLIARFSTLVAGMFAFAIAFASESITGLVETASGLGGPSILILTVVALYVKQGKQLNAILALLFSLGTWIITHYVVEIEYPIILTMGMCILTYVVTLPLTKSKSLVQ